MGNKTSKKKETTTAVTKHQFSTSYRASEPTAQLQNDRSQWMLVVNATAYVRCGSQTNVGTMTNLAASNTSTANRLTTSSEQNVKKNNPPAVVPKCKALIPHSSTSHNAVGNQISQRQNVSTGREALSLIKDHYHVNESDYFKTKIEAKSSQITSTVKAKPLDAKLHFSASQCNANNKIITPYQQKFCAAKPKVTQQTSFVTKPNATTTTTTSNALTIYNSSSNKDNVRSQLSANGVNDWVNTLMCVPNETKQHAVQTVGYTQKYPPTNKFQIDKSPTFENRHEKVQEGFMWRQVNCAEKGCWYHFRRAGSRYRCVLCNVFLSSGQSVIEHAWGKFHQSNLARKRANETEEDLIWRQIPKPEKFHREFIYEITSDKQRFFYCSICNVKIPLVYQNLLTHIQGRNHREEVAFQTRKVGDRK